MSRCKTVCSCLICAYSCGRICHKFKKLEDHRGEESVEGKTVVITGGNAGIGKVVAMQMVKRKARVIIACRDLVKAEAAVAEIKEAVPDAELTLVKLDLGDLESVRNCAGEIKGQVSEINILINNAGFADTSGVRKTTKDGFEIHFGINHLGHYLLTRLLLEEIKRGAPSRIVCVSSLAHRMASLKMDDLNMEKNFKGGCFGMLAYGNSKLCNMLFARELGRRLEGTGVHTYSLCPGLVGSGFYDDMGCCNKCLCTILTLKTVGNTLEQGAETVVYCAVATECAGDTGKAYRFRKYWRSADRKLNDKQAEKLWEVSETLVGWNENEALPPKDADAAQAQVSRQNSEKRLSKESGDM